jgi:photosystem II stability/assembly factor-like uncharacterized protein
VIKKIFIPAFMAVMAISFGAFLHAQGRGEMQGEMANATRDPFRDLHFRSLGPAVAGGRVAAVVGVPGDPSVMYVGAAGGGVWKTTDGGINWRAIWDNMPTASIGSIALAPQNPNWVWVGTGEGNPRNDVLDGRGIYFSSDGGANWKRMGLETTGQIPVVIVSPADANTIYAASLGHVWAANADRGVFRSTDGGKSWQKVLFVNDTTGASDLVMDPRNPKVLYAGMWQVTRRPWILESGGAASGIYRTTDGGDTWQKLTNGLPAGIVGRIGLAVAPSNPEHVYALVESRSGVLWESRDAGDHWTMVSNDRSIQARPFYFSHLYVPQNDEDRIYFLSYDILLSTDGGKNSHIIARGVHPDHHSLWIDPRDADHLIEGNDGGVYVSMDAGEHWRYLDNLPIEQYYSVAMDDRVPYTVCGGLQDNNGWCGPSASLKGGGIGPSDWQTFVGGDGQYVVPGRGGNPYVYGDSQGGAIVRTNRESDESAFVRPYNLGVGDEELGKLKYRFNWTSPIAISPKDSNEVYLGGNVLFRSKDAGAHWETISPDLTRNDKSKQVLTGGPILYDLSNAENYDTILSISISSVDPNVIWVGTDDGCVQVTRDGGAHWTNTAEAMPNLPEWGRISQVDASPSAAGTAYASVDFHEMDNSKPYVFKTDDYGKTWTSITENLPGDSPVHVVREDPNQKGLLIAGSDTGLFYSMNGGEWMPLRAGFPTAPVFDLQFAEKTHDLVVATHGRGVFILDDISPIEHAEMASAGGGGLHLLPIHPAYRWMAGGRGGFSMGAFVAPNPPNGAVIDYYVAQGTANSDATMAGEGRGAEQMGRGARGAGREGGRGAATIIVTDASGKTVRKMNASAHAGFNRAVWPLTYDGPTELDFIRGEGAGGGEGGGRGGAVAVAPGTYHVAVTVNEQTQKEDVRVEADPRVKANPAAFAAATQAALEGRDAVSDLDVLLNRMEATRAQLRLLSRPGGNTAVADRARDLEKKIADMEDPLYNSAALTDSKAYLHYLSRLHDKLTRAAGQVAGNYGEGPTQMNLDELKELTADTKKAVADYDQFLATEGAAFNKFAASLGVEAISIGKADRAAH